MLETGQIFNPSDMANIETTQKLRIEYIKNNLKNAYNQLSRTALSEEEIMDILLKKSTDSPHLE